MKYSLLPLPDLFLKHIIIHKNKKLPESINKILSIENGSLADLIDVKNFEIVHDYQNSLLNKYILNFIDISSLINDIEIPISDQPLIEVLNSEDLALLLYKNRILTLNDISQIGLKKLKDYKGIGLRKVLYIIHAIASITDNKLKENNTNTDDSIELVKDAIKINPEIDKFNASDPRFYEVFGAQTKFNKNKIFNFYKDY